MRIFSRHTSYHFKKRGGLMNQNQDLFSWKRAILFVILAFLVFFGLQLLISYVLLSVPRFEAYYSLCSYLTCILLALQISLCSRIGKRYSFPHALFVSGFVSLMSVVIGLISTMGQFHWVNVSLHCLFIIGSTFLFTLILSYLSSGKKGKRKLHFQK